MSSVQGNATKKEERPKSRAERRKNLQRRAAQSLQEKLDQDMGRIFLAMKDAIEILRELKEAIEEERTYLLELFEIEASAESLEALIRTHEAERSAFEAEMSYQRQKWQEEREALNRARQRDDDEYRHQQYLARQKDMNQKSRATGITQVHKPRRWSPGPRPGIRRGYGTSKT